jgi:hypothetical protein
MTGYIFPKLGVYDNSPIAPRFFWKKTSFVLHKNMKREFTALAHALFSSAATVGQMTKDTKRKPDIDDDADSGSDEDFAPSPSPSPAVHNKKKASSSNKKPRGASHEGGADADADEAKVPKKKEGPAEYGVDLTALDQSGKLTQRYSAMKVDGLKVSCLLRGGERDRYHGQVVLLFCCFVVLLFCPLAPRSESSRPFTSFSSSVCS